MHFDLGNLRPDSAYKLMKQLVAALGRQDVVAALEAHKQANKAFWPARNTLEEARQHKARMTETQLQHVEAILGNPRALLGGFRDTPVRLDVRIDAVQHIGCALLGIEALLSGEELPGSLP